MSNKIVREKRFIFSDVDGNNNKFWYIEEYDDGSCMRRWGRVGTKGQQKLKKNPGRNYFEKQCRKRLKKGYKPLKVVGKVDSVQKGHAVNKSRLEHIVKEEIGGCEEVKKLVSYLTKVNIHNIVSNTTIQYRASDGLFSTPCGIVTMDGINEARKLLDKIADNVSKKNFNDSNYKSIVNEYLMLVPQKVPRKLNVRTLYPDLYSVRKQNDILDSLEASINSLISSDNQNDDNNDNKSKIFDVKLILVVDNKTIDRINKKYLSTLQRIHRCSHLKLKRVYRLSIKEVEQKFDSVGRKIGNVFELWHGTKASNLLSIMKSGLIIPPRRSSHTTGRMWGDGLYFSDQSTKSLNYSYGYWDGKYNDKCYMLLTDVAMGNVYYPNVRTYSPPKGYDSIFAKAGKCGLLNNEMIVYNTNQVNLKYLVEFSR